MTMASIIKFTESPFVSELSKAINSVIEEGAKTVLLLTCIDNNYELDETEQILKMCTLPLCGGAFPKIVHKNKSYSQGAIVLGLTVSSKVVNYSMHADSDAHLKNYIQTESKQIEHYQNFIIISDAFCNQCENFTDHFYDYMGSGISAIGGGAGSMDLLSHPVIFTNQGLVSNVTQVVALPCSISNSIGHGWEILEGPYLVTSSEGHYVHSLNYRPTFELYKEIIQNNINSPLEDDFFNQYAKCFPLGIMSLDGDILVRDSLQTNGAYLECVGNVPVNSMIYLLHSDLHKMTLASEKAAQEVARKGVSNTVLLFDCVTRDLLFGEHIGDELEVIQRPFPNTPLIGVMALGEIANTANGSIRLLNKSTVLGSF